MKTYLVTGACGHLGGTLVRLLERTGAQVRGLRLPSEQARDRAHVTYYPGDVRDRDSLRPLFQGLAVEVGHIRRQAEAHALGQPVGAQEEGAALVQGQVEANARLNRKVVLLDAAGAEAQSLLVQNN